MCSQYSPTSAKYQEVILHFVFTPKYRLPLLTEDVAVRLDEITRGVCNELHVEVVALAIQPDHVHLLVALPRNLTRSSLVHRVKGRSACWLRREFPHLAEAAPKALWGRDYFVRSVGGRRAVRKYIEDQGF